jgi:formate hydrogenlyase subunit 3/multisubunit Na+/H+ antiporter MnhD subunit
MSAPILWIIVPLALSAAMLFLLNYARVLKVLGIIVSMVLAITAFIQPIGNVLQFGSFALDISPDFFIFGRSLVLENSDRFALSLVYSSLFLFLVIMDVRTTPSKFVPLSIAISAMLIAALAVQPFLYSAVLVEMAVLLIVLMVREKQNQPVTGIIRFLIYLTLAMPSVLFAGWILGGSQTGAFAETRMLSAVAFLLFGFAVWLAVFPFHSWMPQFSQTVKPFLFSFIFSIVPVITLLIIIKYLSGLLWLKSSTFLAPALQTIGTIMIITTGIFTSVEKDLKRFMAYTVLLETGFALVMLSLATADGIQLLYQAFIPRIIALVLLGYSLMVIDNAGLSLMTDDLRGVLKRLPFASVGVFSSLLSIVGFPLSAGFPLRFETINLLGQTTRTTIIWIFAGLIGFLIGAIRIFVRFAAPGAEKWQINEKISQILIIGFGLVLLFILGLFPRLIEIIISPFLAEIPDLW